MRHGFSCLVMVGAALVGCSVDDVGGSQVTQALIVPTGGPCPRFGCGANSPVIDTFEIHELSLNPGQRNDQGFAIETYNKQPVLQQGTRRWVLHVENGRIFGTIKGGAVRLEGEDLIGAWVPVTRGKQRYALSIEGVRAMTYFVAPYDAVEAYTLGWKQVDTDKPKVNLCSNLTELEEELRVDPEGARRNLMGMLVAEAIVFEGDRIQADPKTMSPGADDAWFNFGCAGHTLSKLRLTHNTVHSQAAGLPRAWEQRQATLKMLAADYCKIGLPFTVAGQPLVWRGDAVSFFQPPRELEARWDETGPVCLNIPRLEHPTPAGARAFPDIWGAIATFCKPDPCTNLDPWDFAGADRVSANL